MTLILVVDDSKIDLTRASLLLKKHCTAATIATASSGDEAVKMIADDEPDVVVTDVQMPGMSGLDLTLHVRDHYPYIPVVLMTAAGSEKLAIEALRCGAASYVPKTEMAIDLPSIVQNLTGVSQEQRQRRKLLSSLTSASFELANDRRLLAALAQELREVAGAEWGFSQNDSYRISTAVDEALSNAYFHGNLEVSSDLREEDASAFYNLAAERLQQEPFRSRKIHVDVCMNGDLTITIRDQGPGFDPSSLPDPLAPGYLERPCGRGVLLMRSFMDDVEFSDRGNQVTLTKRRSSDEETRNGSPRTV